MSPHPPPSFGRPDDGPVLDPVAINMPDRLPVATLPVVVEIDPRSLEKLARDLTEVVSSAVRAGYATALEDIEFETDEAEAYENPPQQLNEVLREFIADNHEMLARLGRMSNGGPVGTDPPLNSRR